MGRRRTPQGCCRERNLVGRGKTDRKSGRAMGGGDRERTLQRKEKRQVHNKRVERDKVQPCCLLQKGHQWSDKSKEARMPT